MPLRVSRFRLLTIGALALAATALPVATAVSAPKPKPAPGKLYSFVVERHEPKGFTDHAYTMTLANHTGTQQLGSADIGLPAALAILRDPSDLPLISLDRPGTWTLNGSTLELRNLGVPAGESVTVTIEAQMPCDADALTYDVTAKQSNDFSSASDSANVLTLEPGPPTGETVLTTTLDGECKLRFVKDHQPAATERNTPIRAEPYQLDSTELVSVEAVDGRPLDTAEPMTWFTGDITLAPSAGTFTALSKPTSPATDGVASFDNIVIDKSGLYRLHASTQEGWIGDSDEFEIPVFVSPCLVGNCTTGQHLGTDGTAFTVTGSPIANGGKLVLSPNLGATPNCDGYNAPSTDFYKFELTEEAAMTAQLAHNKANVRKVGGPSGLEVCFASPVDFTAKGATALFDYDGNGPLTLNEGHVGLLRDCADLGGTSSPCIDGRTGTAGGGAIVTVSIPRTWSDPYMR